MIVLEGPDGGGKSTLIERLSDALSIPIAPKAVTSQTHAVVNLQAWVEDNVSRGFQATLFDRHRLISGPIYNATFDRHLKGFSDLPWMHLQMAKFYACRPLIIYCLPDFDTVKRNVTEGTADNSAVVDKIATIYDLYVAKASVDISLGLAIRYVYDDENHPMKIIKEVKHHLQARGSQ